MVAFPDLDLLAILSLLSILLLGLLLTAVRHYRDRIAGLEERLAEATSSRQSLATTYGRITEQFAPFLADYPYDPRRFRFLGSPVDGVQFEEDRIVFVEFKANKSRLTPGESRIRSLVEAGRVEWFEFRVAEGAGAPQARRESAEEWRAEPDAEPERRWGAEL